MMRALAFVFCTIVACIPPVQATAAVLSNQNFPVDISVFIPCANGGSGEFVDLTGSLHDTFAVTINRNNAHFRFHDDPQGISGTGSVTGFTYHATGVTRGDFNLSNVNGFPFSTSYTNRFNIVGQKKSNNIEVHETAHVTINADGRASAFFDDFHVTCR